MADPNDPTGPLGRGFEEFKRQSLALASAFNGLTGVFELGIRSLGVAGAEISKALIEVTKVDQRLAVINSDLNSVLGGNTDALEGTTAGLENATRALTELRIAGFQGTNKNLVDLATRLKLSGQNTAALFSLSQSLLGMGNLTEKQIDSFAKNVIDLSKSFGVTGDSIIGAVNELSNNLSVLNIGGGAEAAANFTARLAAVLGPENAKLAGQFAKTLTDVNTDQNQLAILGLEGLANKLFQGIEPSAEELRSSLDRAREVSRSIVGEQGQTTLRSLQAVQGILGDLGPASILIADKLDDASFAAKSFGDKISELFGVVKQNLLAPFNRAIADLQPSFEYLIKGLAVAATSFLNLLASLSPLIAGVSYVVGFIGKVVGGILNAIGAIIASVTQFLGVDSGIGGYGRVFDTLEGLKNSSEDSANSLREIGLATKEERRRELLKTPSQQSELTFLERRRLQDLDALVRSAEVPFLAELLTVNKQQLIGQRELIDETRRRKEQKAVASRSR